jgi:Tn3 transposase DDE domain-containing protein
VTPSSDRAVTDQWRRGTSIDDQRLRRLSPLGWDHINLTGHYAGALSFYLGKRARAMWQTKPNTDVNVNLSLHDLVMGSIKLEEAEKADPKLIEHEKGEPK